MTNKLQSCCYIVALFITLFASKAQAQSINLIDNPDATGNLASAIAYGNSVYFDYYHTTTAIHQLAKYDGVSTTMIPNPEGGQGYQGYPIIFGINLYFMYIKTDGKAHLAKYDGTNITLISNPDGGYGYAGNPIVFGNNLYIQYLNASGSMQLGKYDGANLTLITNPDVPNANGGYVGSPLVFGGNLYIRYYTADFYYKLAKYDDASGNLTLISNPEGGQGYKGYPIVYGSNLYIQYQSLSGSPQLAKYNGSNITFIPNQGGSYVNEPIVFNNNLYVRYLDNNTSKFRLAKYDGTNITVLTNPDGGQGYVGYPIVFGNNLYFDYQNASAVAQLAKCDGSNITLLSNPTGWIYVGANPTVIGNSLYLNYITTDFSTYELAKYTDASGIALISNPDGGAGYAGLPVVSDNNLYFGYKNASGSYQLGEYAPNYVWTGTTSGYWDVASNWGDGIVPTSSSNVVIPAGTPNQPAIVGIGAYANKLQIEKGNYPTSYGLSVYSGSLTLSGALSGDGYIKLGGLGQATLFLASSTTNTMGSLNLVGGNNGVGIANITAPLTLTEGFEVAFGGTVNTNNHLTLASTAQFDYADYLSNPGTINGNIIAQTFIPQDAGAAFRDLGTCVTGASVASFSNQVYDYTASTWSSKLASSTSLTPGKGYRAQVNTATGPVTLSTSGTLVASDVTPTLTQGANIFNFVANPYAAVLDFENLYTNNTSNLYDGYWYFDPTVLSSDGYQTYVHYGAYTGSANDYSSTLTPTQYIQKGQGFFVQNLAAGTSTLKFQSNETVSGNLHPEVFGTKALNKIATGLFIGSKNVDGAVAVFNSKFSNGIDKDDAVKISNHGENVAFTIAGKDYCADAYNLPTTTDKLSMHLYNLKANTTYTLKLDASHFVGNGVDAYLQDNVLNKKTLLVGTNNDVLFTTGTNATTDANRCSIVFGATALPVKSISLTAATLANKQVSIKWKTEGESNVESYIVERSTDGKAYTTLATTNPATSHKYSYVDATANEGVNYYRIKVTDNLGVVSYSNIVKLITNHLPLTTITVTPNPILSNTFKISLGTTGKYTVSLVDVLGKTVYNTTINHNAAASLESVSLNRKLSIGSYILRATDDSGNVTSTEVIIK